VSEFLQRLETAVLSRGLLPRGRKILVAVSGGADSMVLLHALKSLAEKWRWRIFAAHFNHQLRGRSSDADERMVCRAAASFKLPVLVGRADVKRYAQRSRLSVEMAARKLRHEFLARSAREHNIPIVTLAHHADDQVELFFLRLLRGAGGEGLSGMKWRAPSPADAKITLVRPLLGFSRDEVREFARRNKIRFREDATNAQLNAPRNRVRNELLPLLGKNYQPGLKKTVLRLMEIIGAESDLVGDLSSGWLKRRRPHFKKLPVAIQRRVLQSQLVALGLGADFDLVESLRQSADKPVSIGSKHTVVRTARGDVNCRTIPAVSEFNLSRKSVNLAGRAGRAVFNSLRLTWQFETSKEVAKASRHAGREFFDADRVGRRIILRHWRPGDLFQPIGLPGAAKLQDLFTNAKIPRARRHELVVAVAADGRIFWVEGLRISENFKLTPETRRCLAWCGERV
jgi:tRNA(Ile)-lysidine synthase